MMVFQSDTALVASWSNLDVASQIKGADRRTGELLYADDMAKMPQQRGKWEMKFNTETRLYGT